MVEILNPFIFPSLISIFPFIFHSLISIFLIWCIVKLYKRAGNKLSPPSPPKLPIIGNFHQLGSLPHRSLQYLARKHGPLMLLHFGSVPVLVISSADAARELKTHDIDFSDRPQHKASKKIIYGCKDVAFSNNGEYWRKLRSIFVFQLMSNKRVHSYSFIREEETALFEKKIRESSGPVNLSEMFGEFAFDLISRSAFGTKYRESEEGKKVLASFIELVVLLGTISIGDFIPWLNWIDRVTGFDNRLRRVATELDDFLEDVIQQHMEKQNEQEKKGESFVDIMLQIPKENHGDKKSIGRESIKAIILDAFAGATDTISTALEWAMSELLRHPGVMQKLQAEVREIVEEREDIRNNELDKMQFLKAVIKETLRLHPSLPLIPREARKDVNIKGYNISRGTMVMINTWAIGMDPKSWDEPEKFSPERFLDSEIDFKGSNLELVPFGFGRRSCPGISYSMAAIELMLANLVHKFNWSLGDGVEGKDLDMNETCGLTVGRAVPLLAVATNMK